ncbi:MAG: hypothetical protein WC547_09590 [Candidatus Omnitrophota bacterium]
MAETINAATPAQAPASGGFLTNVLGLFEKGAEVYYGVAERQAALEQIDNETAKPTTVVYNQSSAEAKKSVDAQWLKYGLIAAGALVVVLVLVVMFKRR